MSKRKTKAFCLFFQREIPGHQYSTCGPCKAIKQKAWRSTERGKFATEQQTARAYRSPAYMLKMETAKAVRLGWLKPISEERCSRCNGPARYYKHLSQTDPLAVDPRCATCFHSPRKLNSP